MKRPIGATGATLIEMFQAAANGARGAGGGRLVLDRLMINVGGVDDPHGEFYAGRFWLLTGLDAVDLTGPSDEVVRKAQADKANLGLVEAYRQAEEYQKEGLEYRKMVVGLRVARQKFDDLKKQIETERPGHAHLYECPSFNEFSRAGAVLNDLREEYGT